MNYTYLESLIILMDFFRHQLTTFLKETIVIANTHTKYIRGNAINRKIMMQFCFIYDGSYYCLLCRALL